MTVEQLESETARHEREIQASQMRMLKKAEEANQTGAATLEKLAAQGEQLQQIKKDQGKISGNLSTSDRILTSMESWAGAMADGIGGMFGKKKKDGKAKAAPPPGGDAWGTATGVGTWLGGSGEDGVPAGGLGGSRSLLDRELRDTTCVRVCESEQAV